MDTMRQEGKIFGVEPIPAIPIWKFIAPRGIDLSHSRYSITPSKAKNKKEWA